ncbi:MAG: HAMP domain-containing protein [Peptostreptococcaceae bacterium]|nr:HAMP domain-containing protein [Peptostreptococcaceae bacterium]
MKYNLKSKLSLSIALVVLLTVALISLLANFFIGNQFKDYITTQQEKTTQDIVNSISLQFDKETDTWNLDFIHTIGMYALYDGYIIKVYDLKNQTLWDAEAFDMNLCTEVMDDIVHRMQVEHPKVNGKFTSKDFSLMQNNQIVGIANISYFGPYFLSKDDFQFLDSLNKILIGIGIFSLMISILVGFLMARRLSNPIYKIVGVTKQISGGDYSVRIKEVTSTKEVEELVRAVNHLAATLEKQENLRKQLTADVAHELRTPLTTVQTHIEAIIEGIWEPTTERMQSCYDEMTRINKLVSDLERLAKVESGNFKLNKTNINLLDLSNKMVSNFEMEFKNKNLNITAIGDCPDIIADSDRLNQVLMNLISNAIKYTLDGGEIRIIISETEDTAIFIIEDNGIGIAENEIPYIFERFYRADKSRNRMTGGSGIGLAIVKSIVTAHGGSVDVESRLNKGSTFVVTLPKSN